jgi:hypothetical protein
MTPAEKGRFCASCQKAVVDFTVMNDRQLAAFFKKPPASVCGRIYNDQLNRDIVIPGKRIPWFKYFFQFTWPAFVLLLKSCGVKESAKGKIRTEIKTLQTKPEYPVEIVGEALTQIRSADTAVNVVKNEPVMQDVMVEEPVAVPEDDSIETPKDTLSDAEPVYKPMDTVTVIAYPNTRCYALMGAMYVMSVSRSKPDSIKKDMSKDINLKVYPNPAPAGSLVTVSFEDSEDFPEQIRILSSSGQLISSMAQNAMEYATLVHIQIPSNVAAGIYFLQMVTKNKKIKTAKIMVTR